VTDVFVNDPPALPGPALTWKPGEPPVGQSALPQAAPSSGPALPDYAPYGGANMTGLAPGSSDYVSSRLAGEAAAKGEAQTDFDRRAEDQMRQDRQKMAQSYDLEAADARDPALRPWNAEQEKAKYIRGPMENFGSVGMIFAMAASAFTRTPMISALNAGAAAMQATAQSDEKAYKQAFDAWKSNSDLALKRFDMERNLYEDANKLLTTDMGLWKQKSLMLAAQFDNQKMRIMLENGMDKEVLDAQAAQFKAAEEMRKSKFEFEKQDFFRQQYADSVKGYQDAHPGVNDKNKTPEYVAFKAKAWSDALRASQGEPPTAAQLRPLTPDQQQYELIKKKYEGDPDAAKKIAEEYDEFERGKHQPTGQAATARAQAAAVKQVQAEQQRKAIVDDYLTDIDTALGRVTEMKKSGVLPQVGALAGATKLKQSIMGQTDVADLQRNLAQLKEHYKEVFSGKGHALSAEFKELDQIIPGEIQGFNIGLSKGFTWPRFDTLNNVQNALADLRERIKKRYEDLIKVEEAPASAVTELPGGAQRLSDEELRRQLIERGYDPDKL
jgi:hypothetical protein